MFLTGKALWDHIDGATSKPTNTTKSAQWITNDAKIISWILSTVDLQIVLHLRPHKTAKGMWEYLKKVYDQDNSARRFQLGLEISEYSQN